jgi:hypothetical protein
MEPVALLYRLMQKATRLLVVGSSLQNFTFPLLVPKVKFGSVRVEVTGTGTVAVNLPVGFNAQQRCNNPHK